MSAADEALYSLLILLEEDRPIVPRPSVAEVVRYNHAELKEGDHNWMMRMINWNGCPLPVI